MAKREDVATLSADTLEDDTARIKRAISAKRRALKELQELADQEAELLGAATPASSVEAPEEGLPGSEKIESILANLTGEGSFDIIKLGAGGVEDNLGSYDVSAWPEGFNLTLKEHGSGNYLLRFRNKQGKHAGRVMRTYRLPGSPTSASAPAPASGSGDMMAFVKMMQDAADRHERSLTEMRLEMSRQQMESSKNLIELMKAQSSGGLFKNAQDLAVVAKLFKDDNKGSELERLLDLRELLEDFKGSAREEVTADANPLLAMLAPLVAAFIPKPAARRPAPAAAPAPVTLAPPAVAPAPARATPAPIPASAPSADASPMSLAEFVPSFKAAIEAGVMPEDAADFAWKASLEKKNESSLRQLLEQGDWSALGVDPYLLEHSAWLVAFRVHLEKLAFETEPAPQSDAIN